MTRTTINVHSSRQCFSLNSRRMCNENNISCVAIAESFHVCTKILTKNFPTDHLSNEQWRFLTIELCKTSLSATILVLFYDLAFIFGPRVYYFLHRQSNSWHPYWKWSHICVVGNMFCVATCCFRKLQARGWKVLPLSRDCLWNFFCHPKAQKTETQKSDVFWQKKSKL